MVLPSSIHFLIKFPRAFSLTSISIIHSSAGDAWHHGGSGQKPCGVAWSRRNSLSPRWTPAQRSRCRVRAVQRRRAHAWGPAWRGVAGALRSALVCSAAVGPGNRGSLVGSAGGAGGAARPDQTPVCRPARRHPVGALPTVARLSSALPGQACCPHSLAPGAHCPLP